MSSAHATAPTIFRTSAAATRAAFAITTLAITTRTTITTGTGTRWRMRLGVSD